MSGSWNAGTRWTKTGARASRSSTASSGSDASCSYVSSTSRHVVSMPFQSTRSLNAARPLQTRLTKNSSAQYHSIIAAWPSFRSGGGKLQHSLALAHVAQVLARELLDVGRIVAQLVDG